LVHDLLFITLEELDQLQSEGATVRLLDVRTGKAWDEDDRKASSAGRLSPDQPAANAAALALPRHAWLVAYCA